jgi:hypothetical protein
MCRSIVILGENKKQLYGRDQWSITLRKHYRSCILKTSSVRVINSNRNQSLLRAEHLYSDR